MTNPNRQSNSSTQSMFEGKKGAAAPAVKPQATTVAPDPRVGAAAPQRNSVDEWTGALYNNIKTEGGIIIALLKPHSPKGLQDQELLKRFYAKILQYMSDKPGLFGCAPLTVLKAAITATEQGLDINTPNEAHLIPYGNSATLVRGYKGLLKMARRDPSIELIKAVPVHAKDHFIHEEGATTTIVHRINHLEERGDIVLFYALAKTKNGGIYATVMSVFDVVAHAKKNIKSNKGPFSEIKTQGQKGANFEAYGLKTCLLRLINRQLDLHSQDFIDAVNEEIALDEPRKEDAFKPMMIGVIDVSPEESETSEPEAPKEEIKEEAKVEEAQVELPL